MPKMGGACSSEVDTMKKHRLRPELGRTRSSLDFDDPDSDSSNDIDETYENFPITTFVRALEVRNGIVVDKRRISRSTWSRHMQATGRLVVEDKQFQAGGFIRSVPRIQDPSNSTIMKR